MNMSKFENWADPNGKGCGGPCIDIYGMVLTRVYQWEGTMKGTVLPYICASECPIGYAWRRNAKRCIKILKEDFGERIQPEASLYCAKENGRLLSINSCEEFEGLSTDLWTSNPSTTQSYWIGYNIGGFQSPALTQARTSESGSGPINSR